MKIRSRIYRASKTLLTLGKRTYFVGILNLTPDSFSDGGEFIDHDAASKQFHKMVKEGADIIDVGGESTRPGHNPISASEEIARVVPFVKKIRSHTNTLISVDTSKSEVAALALAAGADIINDIWGAQGDSSMAQVIGKAGASCILMHNRSVEEAGTGDVVEEITVFLRRSVELVRSAGVDNDCIILDPGLGFGKTFEENWEVMRRIPELCNLGYPILIGASRKSMIANLLKIKDPKLRLNGTLATTALGIQAGVDFIRVHDIKENRECAEVLDYCVR